MSVTQFTALVLETSELSTLAATRETFAAALEKYDVSDETVFQFVWHPRAPSHTLVLIIENGVLSSEGFQLWEAGLGKTLAREHELRTWELHAASGSVFNQRVEAFDAKGKLRWKSAFDGSLPREAAVLQEDPFVPRALAARATREAMLTLAAGRVEAETQLPLAELVDLDRDPVEAQPQPVNVAENWSKALASWNKKRPRKAAPAEPVDDTPEARPAELLLLWKGKPALEAARLFVHDVARAEGLSPADLGWSVGRSGKATALRFTFGEAAIKSGAADLFNARITWLGELADMALVVTLAGPEFLTMFAAGFASKISQGGMEGRCQITNPQLAGLVEKYAGCQWGTIYQQTRDQALIGPWLEDEGHEVKLGGKRFTAKDWRSLVALKGSAARGRALAKWGPITFEQFEGGLLDASAVPNFVVPVKDSGTLETAALEKPIGKAELAKLRKQWKTAALERVRQGPALSVLLSGSA
jgi:hypothetical protein